jgi:tetratricopeptide (TPR) repeat protein
MKVMTGLATLLRGSSGLGSAGCLLLLLLSVPAAHGQVTNQQLRDQLERGLLSSAARVTGPALVGAAPDDPEARLLYGRALYLTGDFAEAERQLGMIPVDSAQAGTAAYFHLSGLLQASGGDPAGALPALARAFELSQGYREAMDWARTAWQAQDFEIALQIYGVAAATEQGRREPWPYLDQGRLLLILGRLDEAALALEQSIRVFEAVDTGDARPSPAYVEAFYRLGLVHQRLHEQDGSAGQLRLAENNFRAALVADPNYVPALTALEALAAGAD